VLPCCCAAEGGCGISRVNETAHIKNTGKVKGHKQRMTIRRHNTTRWKGTALGLVLIGVLISAACDSGSPASTPITTGNAPAAASPTSLTQAQAPASANTPQGSATNGNRDCQAIANAALDLNTSEPSLVVLAGAGGSVLNRVDSPMYVDTAKLRADLVVLSALPDPTDATQISIMGKPSEAIAQFRQLFDIVDRDANAVPAPGSTPSPNGGPTDQQLLDFAGKFVHMSTAINAAVGDACPNASANVPQAGQPGTQATPLAASYHIGQTAPVGDLRVTLDKVVTLPGAGANLPAAGSRFVFAYFTVENTGKNASQQNMMTGTHWEGATGQQYFFDPDTIMLDPNTTNFDGGIQPGAKQSGAVGYLLPTGAGDLVWVFEDSRPNRAVFAVTASDVVTVGTPVSEPTAAAMREQAAATQTAFVEMALGAVSADATQQALGTDTSAPPEPTDSVAPQDSTDTSASPLPAVPNHSAPVSP
jgi:hypothetical protein